MDVEQLGPAESELPAPHGTPGPVRVRVGPAKNSLLGDPTGSFHHRLGSRLGLTTSKMHVKLHVPLLQLALRVVVLAAAVWYVLLAVQTVAASIHVLGGNEIDQLSPLRYHSELIAGYAGTDTIGNSPLIQEVLGGDTSTTRTDAIYLEAADSHSFTGCSAVKLFNAKLYSSTFQRYLFSQMKTQLAYNITDLADLDLIAPVVDCTFRGLTLSDESVARVYFLARRTSDPTTVLLLSTSMVIQNYYVTAQYRRGPALFMSIGFISDMQAPTVDYRFAIALNYPYEAVPTLVACCVSTTTDTGFWQLTDIPPNPNLASVRSILTARREGFYIDDPETQSNLKNWHWEVDKDPTAELSEWDWHGHSVLRDSWAWTHAIHAVFGFFAVFQLLVLLFISFRCYQKGELWIGDAFSNISSTLLYRGVLVLLANMLNGFYTWTEYSLAIAYSIADLPTSIFYRADLLHSDFLTLYLNVATVVSYATKERVHPLVAGLGFLINFVYRAEQAKSFSLVSFAMTPFAESDYKLGISQVNTALDSLSPFRLRTMHTVDMELRGPAITAAVFNVITGLSIVVIYIIIQKSVKWLKRRKASHDDPDRRRTSSGLLQRVIGSGGHEKPQLTLFESATGAVLQKRFGVITEYDNYVEANGRRYAAADAIYGNGFVVANRKFLVAIDDLMAILIIKITRLQFKSVFVYDIIDGDTTKQTARLVYPSTIAWADLAQIGIANLA